MKKHIAEGLPERKHAPAAFSANSDKGQTEKPGDKLKNAKTPEARVRQAVYDIRYRARREEMSLQQAFSDYMNHSSMSAKEKALVRAKLLGKGGGGSVQAEDFNIEDAASTDVAKALYKVFVEGKKTDPMVLTYMEAMGTMDQRKYKVRVTDKNGRSYVRYATREKITQLRQNPNIESVEITGYGEPYEGEKKKGEQTAAAKRGDNLDPVGKEDDDVNNDGKVDKTDKYLKHRRDVRGAAISGRENVGEAFIAGINPENANPNANPDTIDVLPTNKSNKVTINPQIPGFEKTNIGPSMQFAHYTPDGVTISETGGYAKFLGMLQEKSESQQQQKLFGLALSIKRGETPRSQGSPEVLKIVDSMSEKKIRDFAKTSHEGLPEKVDEETHCVDDPRSRHSELEVVKNRIRAKLGIKNPNPMMMVAAGYEPDGNVISEREWGDDERDSPETRRHNAALGHKPFSRPLSDRAVAALERERARKKQERTTTSQENLRSKGKVPKKGGKPMFENKNSK